MLALRLMVALEVVGVVAEVMRVSDGGILRTFPELTLMNTELYFEANSSTGNNSDGVHLVIEHISAGRTTISCQVA